MKMVSSVQVEPVSRTDQYKRVMKPLLERKRRARINRCLDELRDLLVAAMQAEGETVTRLEKADILELTVRHVRRLNQRRRLTLPPAGAGVLHDPRQDAVKFQQGFLAAAQQVQTFLLSTPSLVEPSASSRLLVHLSSCASAITGRPSPHEAPPPPPPPQNPHAIASPLTPSTPTITSPPPTTSSGGAPHQSHIISPKCSPSMSPPHLMDLSIKAPHSSPQSLPPRIVAPTPIRKEPVIIFKEPCGVVGPQDLSMRKEPSRTNPQQETKDAWRPW